MSRPRFALRRGPLAALLAAALLALAPAPSRAADAGPIVYDLLVIRPLALAHTLVGCVAFVPVALFTLPSGTTREGLTTFVLVPMNDLVVRKLGDF